MSLPPLGTQPGPVNLVAQGKAGWAAGSGTGGHSPLQHWPGLLQQPFGVDHSNRLPFTSPPALSHLMDYPGWQASEKLAAEYADSWSHHHWQQATVLQLNPGMLEGFLRLKGTGQNPHPVIVVESDPVYYHMVLQDRQDYPWRTKPEVYPSLDAWTTQTSTMTLQPAHSPVAVVHAPHWLANHTPEERETGLKQLRTRVLAPDGYLVLNEPVVQYKPGKRWHRSLALVRHGLAMAWQALRHGTFWGLADILLQQSQAGLKRTPLWQPLQDGEIREVLARNGFEVVRSERLYPEANQWQPFLKRDKEGVWVYVARPLQLPALAAANPSRAESPGL